MDRWEEKEFVEECQAWIHSLKQSRDVSPLVSLEFSHWQLRGNRYLVRRIGAEGNDENDEEIHIVYSVNYGCPVLLLKSSASTPEGKVVKKDAGVLGGFEYHPVIDEPFYVVHGCETRMWMGFLDHEMIAPGVRLLSWWSVLANTALTASLQLPPKVFLEAKAALEAANRTKG